MTIPAGGDKLEILADILRLERQRGFRDDAVIGGLDAFLKRWSDEISPSLRIPRSYASLTVAQRARWADYSQSSIGSGTSPDTLPVETPLSEGTPEREPPAPETRPDCDQSERSDSGDATARDTRQTTQRKTVSTPKQASQRTELSLGDDVALLSSVNARTKARLSTLGIETVEDLIYHFPHRHDDFTNVRKISELVPGEIQTLVATVWEVSVTGRGRVKNAQAVLGDKTGNIRVVWFNQGYLARTLSPGMRIVISGMAKVYRGRIVFQSPEYDIFNGDEGPLHAGRLVPIYPLTDGLYQRTIRRAVKQALDVAVNRMQEYAPSDTLHLYDLMDIRTAIRLMHYPESLEQVEQARRRIAFDEMLMLQLVVAQRRIEWQSSGGAVRLHSDGELLDAFIDSLPYSLTSAQSRSLDEILADLNREIPMSRLLQGDVGSGKTVVATVALLLAALNGQQGALMAPTTILSEQHFLTVSELLGGEESDLIADTYYSAQLPSLDRKINVCLLTGSLNRRAREEMHGRIAAGEIDIIIGTQALIQDTVDIPNLALVVVDEQHRFGVLQRMNLRRRGGTPHMLAMSATPIPRSVRLTMLGDLELSAIDEMPPGRQQIRTRWIAPDQRENAYEIVREEVDEGRQAFIICPLIEESEAIQARAATEEYERLSRMVFSDLQLGLLHGRLNPDESEAAMRRFKEGETDILVATSVIEVGIDIPNATVMLIDGADRFGLAQLHQFRGRVGRGEHPSQCLLLSDSPTASARERIRILERTMDGFEIAEEDLRIRGAGEYMGTRQSGLNDLKVATLMDFDIMQMARKEARRLLSVDQSLTAPEHSALATRFKQFRDSHPVEIS